MKLTLVTGLSGSGKSIALATLEDMGHYCVDNLPLGLLPALTEDLCGREERLAVGIDVRNPAEELDRLGDMLERLASTGVSTEIIYLEARTEILIRRYRETRRPHPLASAEASLEEAIARERALLEPLALRAHLRIDTSDLNVHQLRRLIQGCIAPERERVGITPRICSFGFKHGVPMDADFVFDVRCLPNPHWNQQLRPLTGKDAPVQEFLHSHEEVERMFEQLRDFLLNWLPAFEQEGRRHLTVAIGCTGGQHRSVYLAERLGSALRERYPSVVVRHRELS